MTGRVRTARLAGVGLWSTLFVCDEADVAKVCAGRKEPDNEASLRNVDATMLTTLCNVACLDDDADAKSPRQVHPAEAYVYEVRQLVVDRMAALDSDGVQALAAAWVTAMRSDLETIKHPSAREGRLAGCTLEAWLSAVEQIAELACDAEECGLSLYLRVGS